MEEFLRSNYSLLIKLVELIAAVTGLFCLKKYKGTAVIFFIYFLVYIVFIEAIGDYPSYFIRFKTFDIIQNTPFEKNRWWFTIFWKIGAILFFAWYYQKILKSKVNILYVKIARNIFLYFSIIYIIFNWDDFFIKPFPVISIVGGIIIFLCVALYFIELLNSDKILSFYKSLNFWISVIILIWWLITTPLVFYDVYFSKHDWNFVILKWQIYLFANIFMYLSFTFALLWCNPKRD